MNKDDWSYSVEYEWADWDTSIALPEGCLRSNQNYMIVNSNGVANDPSLKLYKFGGSILTPLTSTIFEQAKFMNELKKALGNGGPSPTVNYRSQLHIHIQVPGLSNNLTKLKSLQACIHARMPAMMSVVSPIPEPNLESGIVGEQQGERRRWQQRRIAHQVLLVGERLKRQRQARTVDSFFEREVPQTSKGVPLWHCQPKVCVNLRELLATDTIEFRMFPGTLDGYELETAIVWCSNFLYVALGHQDFDGMTSVYTGNGSFPQFKPYNHRMEEGYKGTCHDGSIDKGMIKNNIGWMTARKGEES